MCTRLYALQWSSLVKTLADQSNLQWSNLTLHSQCRPPPFFYSDKSSKSREKRGHRLGRIPGCWPPWLVPLWKIVGRYGYVVMYYQAGDSWCSQMVCGMLTTSLGFTEHLTEVVIHFKDWHGDRSLGLSIKMEATTRCGRCKHWW